MTLRELSFDIQRLLQNSKLVDDSRISERHINYKIHQYRARGIRETYEKNGEIDPAWLQILSSASAGVIHPYVVPTKINAADDASLTGSDCYMGKYTLPAIVSLPGQRGSMHDNGIHRVSAAGRKLKYYATTMERYFGMVKGSFRANHAYYFRVQNDLYMSPYRDKMSIAVILDNPLDNNITDTDTYPISYTLAEYIVMKILTQDFNIESKTIGDLREDAEDALIALRKQQQAQ